MSLDRRHRLHRIITILLANPAGLREAAITKNGQSVSFYHTSLALYNEQDRWKTFRNLQCHL